VLYASGALDISGFQLSGRFGCLLRLHLCRKSCYVVVDALSDKLRAVFVEEIKSSQLASDLVPEGL
jgi:hypothetical protein